MRSRIITFLLFLILITFPISQANDHEDFSPIDKGLQLEKITKYQSDSVSTRVRFIVIHFTSLNWEDSLRVLTEEQFAVSSHYLIPESEDQSYPSSKLSIYQLVDEKDRAWHAGKSQWEERTNINDQSIGIELVNQAECNFNTDKDMRLLYRENYSCTFPNFDSKQIDLLIPLLKEILDKHEEIKPTYIVGHSDIAPDRKFDPGPKFPWKFLYENGIGAWYEDSTRDKYLNEFESGKLPSLSEIQCALNHYGYKIETTSSEKDSFYVIRAFQYHFRPAKANGELDIETIAILWALLDKYFPKALDGNLKVICPSD